MNPILNTITIVVCLACFIILLFRLIFVRSKQQKVEAAIKDIQDLPADPNNPLAGIVEGYSKTFCDKTTSEFACDYFNSDSVASALGINLRRLNSVPNILTSLGILGTFLGLAIAVMGFDSETSEGIRQSIQTLLSGMSTAFLTSVAGMASSIIFLIRERSFVNHIATRTDDLCNYFDKKYHRPIGQTVSIVKKDIYDMRNQLQQFGTDFFDSLGNALDNSFNDKLVPILDDLAKKLENPAQTISDCIIKELKVICDKLGNSLTDDLNKRMDDLLERFIDASNAINALPDKVEGICNQLNESCQRTIKSAEEISASLQKHLPNLNEVLKKFDDVARTISKLHDGLESMPDIMATASDAISKASDQLASSQTGIDQKLKNINAINKKTTENIAEYTNKINSIQSGLSKIFDDITKGLEGFRKAVGNSLQGMLDPFSTTVTVATENLSNSIAPLNDTVTELQSAIDKLLEYYKQQ